jgi:ketosteroid isomerase-like protein
VSREDVELVRGGLEAFSRGDLDGALAGFHEQILWEVDPNLVPDAAAYRGHEGVREFWSQWREAFEGFRLQIEELDEVNDGRVLAVTRAEGTGSGSGASVASPQFCQLFDVEDGEVTRVRLFATKAAALAAE